MKEKQPTIVDVAERAGVSIATVSRTISGGSVSGETRRRVEEAMRELDYRPAGARGGHRGGERDIAMVISSQTSPYYAAMCEGMTAEAARGGYRLLSLNYPDTTPCETIAADLLSLKPAGALLAGYMVERSAAQDSIRDCLRRLQQAMPLVAIGPPIDGIECPRLTSDPGACVRKSMAHLYNLGHRRIAFVGGDRSARFSLLREGAYLEEVRRLGCREDPSYLVQTGCNAPAGELGVSILLANHAPQDYPTAILAINDLTALGALRQLQRMGIRVPEQMALVGCDNAFFAPYLTPSLTTVDLHPYEHGRSAMAELIMSISAGHPISFNQSYESSLIVRESCGAALGTRSFD
ncbi:MAG: LacI family DNA-binding transcriptional regulator [Clostridia bacterium]|nr:LacI family DNA-binding transcriptional regulator [Clostridia bacterium]